jgi:hypothetical protein
VEALGQPTQSVPLKSGSGFEEGVKAFCFATIYVHKLVFDSAQLHAIWVPRTISPGLKQQKNETGISLPSTVKDKDVWSLISMSSVACLIYIDICTHKILLLH